MPYDFDRNLKDGIVTWYVVRHIVNIYSTVVLSYNPGISLVPFRRSVPFRSAERERNGAGSGTERKSVERNGTERRDFETRGTERNGAERNGGTERRNGGTAPFRSMAVA